MTFFIQDILITSILVQKKKN